jgi:ribose transport system substrate-binding protein
MNNERKYRIGYASDGADNFFTSEVMRGLERAANEAAIELLVEDNRCSPKIALRVAEKLINEKVDLLIEFQVDYHTAPVISSKCQAARIPLIAVEIPHPGATFFGANNYEAGLIGGRYLGTWAGKYWQGKVDEIILVEQRCVGPLPRSRLAGVLSGIREVLRSTKPVVDLDSDGDYGRSWTALRNHLRGTTAKRFLVGTMDDPSALGVIRAFEEAGRLDDCVVMGQNADPQARQELRRPGTRLIGSVGYFPEKYGDGLIGLALKILNKNSAPPAVFVKHCLITSKNVDHYYPNDALMGYDYCQK